MEAGVVAEQTFRRTPAWPTGASGDGWDPVDQGEGLGDAMTNPNTSTASPCFVPGTRLAATRPAFTSSGDTNGATPSTTVFSAPIGHGFSPHGEEH